MKHIQNIITCLIISLMLLGSCKPVHQVIVHHEYQTHIVDSVVTRDSTVLIPVEHVVDVVNKLDTLKMSTSLASATAYLDTANMLLRGDIKNKQGAQFQYINIDHYHTKDSLVYEEKPVPYPEYVKNPVNGKILTWAIITSIGLLVCLIWIFRKWIIKLISLI